MGSENSKLAVWRIKTIILIHYFIGSGYWKYTQVLILSRSNSFHNSSHWGNDKYHTLILSKKRVEDVYLSKRFERKFENLLKGHVCNSFLAKYVEHYLKSCYFINDYSKATLKPKTVVQFQNIIPMPLPGEGEKGFWEKIPRNGKNVKNGVIFQSCIELHRCWKIGKKMGKKINFP